MLTLGPRTKVFVARDAVDLRRGHDGLCALVSGVLALDPYSGHFFVFFGKRGDRVKILFWDRGGFVVYYKRLAKGRFRIPKPSADADRIELDSTELLMLLGGFDVRRATRARAWEPKRQRLA
jgi:transposase